MYNINILIFLYMLILSYNKPIESIGYTV